MSDTQQEKDSTTTPPKVGGQEPKGAKPARAQAAEVEAVKETAPLSNDLEGGVEPGTDPADVGQSPVQTIGVDDDMSGVQYDESSAGTLVTLKTDVVEVFYFPDTKRPSYRLLYAKGQTVNKAELEAYNALMARRKMLAENGGKDPVNPAGIDATTLASGTYPGIAPAVEAEQQ